jgi:hypothetical protein
VIDFQDVAVRAAKTFAHAFLGLLAGSAVNLAHLPSVSDAEKLLLALVISAAGVAWNAVLVPAYDKFKLQQVEKG